MATPHRATVPYPRIDQATLCLVKTILMPVLMEDEPWFPGSDRNLIIHRLSSLFFHDLISNLLIKSKHNNIFHISLFSTCFGDWGGVYIYILSYRRVGWLYVLIYSRVGCDYMFWYIAAGWGVTICFAITHVNKHRISYLDIISFQKLNAIPSQHLPVLQINSNDVTVGLIFPCGFNSSL